MSQCLDTQTKPLEILDPPTPVSPKRNRHKSNGLEFLLTLKLIKILKKIPHMKRRS